MKPAIPRAALLAALAFSLATAQQRGQPQKPDIAVTISVPNATVVSGEGVWLDLAITNLSDHEVGMPGLAMSPDDGDLDFEITCIQSDGRPAPPTAFVRRWASTNYARGGSLGGTTIAPRGVARMRAIVTQLYDLTIPGTYRVSVAPRVNPAVHSKELQITVVYTTGRRWPGR